MFKRAPLHSGHGRELMRWAVERAAGGPLTVATETCAADAERLYARLGLRETFAELVMRHPLDEPPVVLATGGLSHLMFRVCDTLDHHEPDLTLIGLRLVYERNN